MKTIVWPLFLLAISIVGWVIEYLNAKKTNTPRRKLRWSLLVLFIFACAWGIYEGLEDAKEKDRTENKLNEIAEAVNRLGLDPKILLEKYPLGYVIFEIDYRNAVFLYDNKLLDKYELNWDVAGLKKITPERYEFRLPDIKTKGGSTSIANIIISGPIEVGGWEGGAIINTLLIGGRVLDIKKDGIVFLVYFEEIPPFPTTPESPSSDKPL